MDSSENPLTSFTMAEVWMADVRITPSIEDLPQLPVAAPGWSYFAGLGGLFVVAPTAATRAMVEATVNRILVSPEWAVTCPAHAKISLQMWRARPEGDHEPVELRTRSSPAQLVGSWSHR